MFNNVRKEDPDDLFKANEIVAKNYFDRGIALYEEEQYEEALGAFSTAIKLDFKNIDYYIIKANVLYRLERYEEVLAVCDIIITSNNTVSNSHKIIAYYTSGIILNNLGKYEDAFKYFEKASNTLKNSREYSPENKNYVEEKILKGREKSMHMIMQYHFDESYKLSSQDQDQEALDMIRAGIELTAYYIISNPYNILGGILYKLKKYQKALDAYDVVIKLDDNILNSFYKIKAYYESGAILNDLGRYEDALEYFNKASDMLMEGSEAMRNNFSNINQKMLEARKESLKMIAQQPKLAKVENQNEPAQEATDKVQENNGANNEEDTHTRWYTDIDIYKCLKQYKDCIQDIKLISNDNNQLIFNIKSIMQSQDHNTIALAINHGTESNGIYTGSHWSALLIKYNVQNQVQALYNDSIGNLMDEKLKKILIDCGINENNIIDFHTQQQNNGYDCGPWTVFNLHSFASLGSIAKNIKDENIREQRKCLNAIKLSDDEELISKIPDDNGVMINIKSNVETKSLIQDDPMELNGEVKYYDTVD